LIWQAPLVDRRDNSYNPGDGFVVIVQKPINEAGEFSTTFDSNRDYVDGFLNNAAQADPPTEGFTVVGP
jgi:hypothetical protein